MRAECETHSSKPRHDHFFINFSAVVAAVFGDLETYCYCSLCGARGRDDLGEFAVRGSERDEGADDASMTDRGLLSSAFLLYHGMMKTAGETPNRLARWRILKRFLIGR